MRKLMRSDQNPDSRRRFVPHALTATVLMFAGFLVIGLAQMGGGASAAPSLRGLTEHCSRPPTTTDTITLLNYKPKTVTTTRTRTVTATKAVTKTVTVTKTKTLCLTKTVTTVSTTTATGTTSNTETEVEPPA